MAIKLKSLGYCRVGQLQKMSSSPPTMKEIVETADMTDQLILVDTEDQPIGVASKFNCHLWSNIASGGVLHRAFSVFLFNSQHQLLLQKRADVKKTFAGLWTNSCCSHPLANELEMDSKGETVGVSRAAERKLDQELGLKIPATNLQAVSRLLYKAQWNEVWGEHEIDYCLVGKSDAKPIPNLSEVSEIRYVSKMELQSLLDEAKESGEPTFTPWFLLVARHFLFHWWDHLDDLSKVKDLQILHKF